MTGYSNTISQIDLIIVTIQKDISNEKDTIIIKLMTLLFINVLNRTKGMLLDIDIINSKIK